VLDRIILVAPVASIQRTERLNSLAPCSSQGNVLY